MFCNITNRRKTIYRDFKAKLTKKQPNFTHKFPQKTSLKNFPQKTSKKFVKTIAQ